MTAGAYTSFANREVTKWLEQRQLEETTTMASSAQSSRHDIPTASVGLAGTQLSSSIYGTVVFDLTLFIEATQSDDILTNIRASVIDSCIEVIIGLPDIRAHRIIHCITSSFDTPDPAYLESNATRDDTTSHVRETTLPLSLLRQGANGPATNVAVCRGASPCKTCADLIARSYDNTKQRMSDLLDPLEDDDEIEWKHNPFDVDFIDEERESPEQLCPRLPLRDQLIDAFATKQQSSQ